MSKQIVIEPEKCISCRTCMLVCSFKHFNKFAPALSAVSVFEYEKDVITVPIMCLQCDQALCSKVCPTGALSHNSIGVMSYNYDKCITCKLCLQACPLGCITYSPVEQKVFKCDFCDGDPECVKHCAAGALTYEDPADDNDRIAAVALNLKKATEATFEEVA